MSDSFWDWGNRVYLFLPDTGDQTSAATDLAGFCDPDLLSLANVRYLISPVRLIGPGLTPISGDGTGEPLPLFVYENTRVLPRFFLTRSIRALPDSTAVLDAMADASAEELASVAYVETKDSNALGLSRDSGSVGSVDVLSSEADVVSLSVTADEPGFLVTSMTYSPYWRAFIDGRETDIVPTDAAFIGAAVPLGTHRVELRYDPPYAWLFPG